MAANSMLPSDSSGWDVSFKDDLTSLLDMDTESLDIPADLDLGDDLKLPMLDDVSFGPLSEELGGAWQDMGDSSDSGVSECFTVKQEPVSPTNSTTSECGQLQHVAMDFLATSESGVVSELTWGEPSADSNALSTVTDVKTELPDTPPRSPPLGAGFTSDTATIPTLTHATTVLQGVNGFKIILPASSQPSPLPGTSLLSKHATGKNTQPSHKIQPKPVTAIKPKTATGQSNNKPLVLTQQEFAKLAAQGVFKLTPANQKKDVVKEENLIPELSVKSPPPLSSPTLSLSGSASAATDYKIMKRQQRMIKNRESACLSRKRKKEYMASLEQKLREFNDDNVRLRQENTVLKRKVDQLQAENDRLKKPSSGGVKRVATVLLGVMFLLSLNLPHLSFITSQSRGVGEGMEGSMAKQTGRSLRHAGRTLLAYDETEEADLNSRLYNPKMPSLEDTLKSLEKILKHGGFEGRPRENVSEDLTLVNALSAAMCPSYLNTTESRRLTDELRGWVLGHEAVLKRSMETDKDTVAASKRTGRSRKKSKSTVSESQTVIDGSSATRAKMHEQGRLSKFEVDVFSGRDRFYHRFLTQFNRRNDTLYVVSFHNDHLLLPATSYNTSTRPRMALVMPAAGLNETVSLPEDSVTMMQIDCEVTDTHLVHIHKSAVPQHVENASWHAATSGHDSSQHRDPAFHPDSSHRHDPPFHPDSAPHSNNAFRTSSLPTDSQKPPKGSSGAVSSAMTASPQ